MILIFTLVVLILLYRFLKRHLYLTSYYKTEKEFEIDSETLKKNVLKAMTKTNFKKISNNENCFRAISSPSFSSFSEKINIEINKNVDSKNIVKFKSTCFWPLQIFDWGKNKYNAHAFFENLSLIV